MKWLITGGCGFIGRALIGDLLTEGNHRIRVLDNLVVGTPEALARTTPFRDLMASRSSRIWSPGVSLMVGDVRDLDDVERAAQGADVIVHLAANTGVPQSVADPAADYQSNVLGTFNTLEACRVAGIDRFVFASSGATVGKQRPPLHESMATRPASPYGASKMAGEGYCSAYYHCFGIEAVALRFGNVYGEGSDQKGSVVAKFIKRALAGESLEIYGSGDQTRDFIHISDLTSAIRRAADVPGVGGEVFQVASARETTVSEMTDLLIEALRAEGVDVPDVIHGTERAGDVARNFSDTSKAQARLGWNPGVSLPDGLRRTVRYFLMSMQRR